MEIQDFMKAIDILSTNHSAEIIINYVKKNSVVHDLTKPTIHVYNCVPAAINKLKEAGFMLSMNNGLLSIDKL